MKVLLSVLLCLNIAFPFVEPVMDVKKLGPKFEALVTTLHELCIQKSKVDESAIERVKQGVFDDTDNKYKKYVTCLWTDSSTLNDDGSLNYDLIDDILPPQLKKTLPILIKKCFDEGSKEKTLEEHVYVATKCFYNADPVNFIMFRR